MIAAATNASAAVARKTSWRVAAGGVRLPPPVMFVLYAVRPRLEDVGGLVELLYRHRAYLPGSPDPCQHRPLMIPKVTWRGPYFARQGCNPVVMPGSEGAEGALERADEAMARFDVEAAVAHLSAAIRGFTAADEPRRAAMACVRLGAVLANSMGNLTASRAWFARAQRLVEQEPPCLEQGWVAVAAMGCDVDDPAALQAAAELALDRARRFGDVNLETKALADAGLAHVQAGRVAEGMALLDEAMALACGPADDTGTAAKSVCSFFTACYFAADFERAGSWTDLLRHHGLISSVRRRAGVPLRSLRQRAGNAPGRARSLERGRGRLVPGEEPRSRLSCRDRAGTRT